MNFSAWSDWALLSASSRWILLADLFCIAGLLFGAWAGIKHYRVGRSGGAYSPRGFTPAVAATLGAITCTFVALWNRGMEVGHFPSQTMGEVLTVFSFSLLLSLLVLHFAMGVYRRGPLWAILDDSLTVVVMVSALAVTYYMRTLSTAQRDLPPALQSYWFAPHISALVYSYATLSIAGIVCVLYFAVRFWCGVFGGGRGWKSQALVLGLLVLIPFAQIVTIPILIGTGVVLFLMRNGGKLPTGERLASFEKDLDEVSFRAFAVGIPFLTAGLWMGSFWAQEAWANYWGWDSKENSALITWMIYIVYFHLRMLGGYRGEKAMAVLVGGALSIFLTFQIFGYLPDSQKNSMHKYTDDSAPAVEGQQGPSPDAQASVER